MFYKKNNSGFTTARQGIRFKTLARGKRTHLTEFHLEKGSVVPRHAHPQEQTGYVVSGRMKFVIGGDEFDARPGDGWNIPANIEHGVEVLEDTVVIEIFSPARQDYLDLESSS